MTSGYTAAEFVQVGDRRVAYRRTGEGPALLLLHGAMCDSRVWRLVASAFSDDHTVVAWDAPGCGESSDPPDDFRMPEFADCLAGFIDALALEPPNVMGHSWGSALALELCLRRPTLVRSLILVGGYAGWAGSLPSDDVQRRLRFALAAADAIETDEWDPRSMPGLFSDALPPEHANELVEITSAIRPAGTRTMAHALAECDLRSALGDVDAPTPARLRRRRRTITVAGCTRSAPCDSAFVVGGDAGTWPHVLPRGSGRIRGRGSVLSGHLLAGPKFGSLRWRRDEGVVAMHARRRTARSRWRLAAVLIVLPLLLSGCFYDLALDHQERDPSTRPWWCNSMGGEGTHGSEYYMERGITKGMLSWDDCLELSQYLQDAWRYAAQWPTRGEAEAAGWRATVNYAMGMGTHHALGNPLQGEFNPSRPNFLQYDGNTPDAKLVGMSWYVNNGPDAPPEGFPGDNDWWHTHEYLCISNSTGLVIRDGPCLQGQNGNTVYLGDYWMVHAWIVLGWYWQPDVFIGHHPCLLESGPAAPDDMCWHSGHHMEH